MKSLELKFLITLGGEATATTVKFIGFAYLSTNLDN